MVDRATSTILTIRQMQLTIDDRAVVMVTIVKQVEEEKEEGMVGCEAGERLRLVEPAALLVDILVEPAPVAGSPLLWKLVELVGKCLSRYMCLLS